MGYRPSVRSRWLDFGQVFFCAFMDRDGVEVHKVTKKERSQSSHLDRTNLVDKDLFPTALQGAVRWETLGTRLLLNGFRRNYYRGTQLVLRAGKITPSCSVRQPITSYKINLTLGYQMAKLSFDGCREWYVFLSILNNIVYLYQTVTVVRRSKTFNKPIKSTLMNCNEFYFLLYVYLFFCSFWWLNMIVIYETKKGDVVRPYPQ